MPAILIWIAESWLGRFVLQFVLGKLIDAVKAWKKNWDERRADEKKADDAAQKLKDAKTGEEIDAATDDVLGDV